MRIFRDLYEMHSELERELKHNGIIVDVETVQDKMVAGEKEFLTKELLGYSFLVRDTSLKDQWLVDVGGNLGWARAEFKERTSKNRVNPGKAWKLRRELWGEFLHEGQFAYTYNERLREQLDQTIALLKKYPKTRQAVINIYDYHLDHDHRGGLARIPCSMFYQFLVRPESEEDTLQLIYVMRSCDFITHFPYDVWLAIQLRDYIAAKLDMKTGDFVFFASSLHVFHKDKEEIF